MNDDENTPQLRPSIELPEQDLHTKQPCSGFHIDKIGARGRG